MIQQGAKDELEPLLSALFDGSMDDAQRERFNVLIKNDAEARAFYFEYCEMHAMLQWQHGVLGGLSTVQPERLAARSAITPLPMRRATITRILIGLTAAAAMLALAFLYYNPAPTEETAAAEVNTDSFAARISGAHECTWAADFAPLQLGDHLRPGQHLELTAGSIEVTFACGAQVLLEGPAAFDINSPWEASLRNGVLKASVPPEAIGFRITSASVDVVDSGTEFSMITDEKGATEVFVLKGAVEAVHTGTTKTRQEKVVLREKEARRFSRTGSSEVKDRERKVLRWSRPVKLDRFAAPRGFVHWTFDELNGRTFRAQTSGEPSSAFDARLQGVSDVALANVQSRGHFERALKFDGQLFAAAPFPGISKNTPRTVAFWMKLEANASLSDASQVIAWDSGGDRKEGKHAVQIGWNRNPGQGAVGALRTELGKGFVIGATPLRDGQWHHIAVVFVPGARAEDPVHVSQYVDGRLEGLTSKPGKQRRAVDDDSDGASEKEVVFMGRGFRNPQQRRERFKGEMDELFIVDRALAPREIVFLMKENQPAPTTQPALAIWE